MKQIFITTLVALSAITLKASDADSVKHKPGIQSVEILIDKKVRDTTYTRNDTTVIRFGHLKIKVNPKDIQVSKDSTKHKIKKPKNIENSWLGFDLGLCNLQNVYQTNSEMAFDLRQSKSVNVKLYLLQQRINLVHHKLNLRWGAGLTWNNYRFNNSYNVNLLKNSGNETIFTQRDSVIYTKNKFVTKAISVPLMLELKLGKNDSWKAFRLAAGIEANLMIDAWQKQISGERGKQKRNEGNYNLTQFPLNYVVRLGVGKLNFYGTYAMTPMFNASQQNNHTMPKMYPWAVGIQLSGL